MKSWICKYEERSFKIFQSSSPHTIAVVKFIISRFWASPRAQVKMKVKVMNRAANTPKWFTSFVHGDRNLHRQLSFNDTGECTIICWWLDLMWLMRVTASVAQNVVNLEQLMRAFAAGSFSVWFDNSMNGEICKVSVKSLRIFCWSFLNK